MRLLELASGAFTLIYYFLHRLERRVEILDDRHRVAEEVIRCELSESIVPENLGTVFSDLLDAYPLQYKNERVVDTFGYSPSSNSW